jgi:hypothetical protein
VEVDQCFGGAYCLHHQGDKYFLHPRKLSSWKSEMCEYNSCWKLITKQNSCLKFSRLVWNNVLVLWYKTGHFKWMKGI